MATLANTFEGGTSGTNISAANSGGASGDAFSSVGSTGGAPAFDNTHSAHGSLAAKVSTGASSGTCSLVYIFAGGATFTLAMRAYLYFTALPTVNAGFFEPRFSTGSGIRLRVVASTGKIAVTDTGGTLLGTMSTAIPTNAWFRVEVSVTFSATTGTVTINRYDSMDSTTPSDTLSVTNANTGGSGADRMQFGVTSSSPAANVGPYWLDDIAANDTGAAIGPSVVPASVAPPAGAAVAAPTAPSVTAAAAMAPPAAVATGAATAPAVATAASIAPPAGQAAAASTAPTVSAATNVAVPAASATATTTPPAVTAAVSLAIPAGVATAAATPPSFTGLAALFPPAAAATASTTAPVVTIIAPVDTPPERVYSVAEAHRAYLVGPADRTTLVPPAARTYTVEV